MIELQISQPWHSLTCKAIVPIAVSCYVFVKKETNHLASPDQGTPVLANEESSG